ncbi:MAG: hypothetical protein BWY69_00459 [Planctomycetes bacterium ADurb.Bin401]|nr:MAG: hypothetical protein BWY69_00459 [Planctomycetes bacterium ADurb.Bin401]
MIHQENIIREIKFIIGDVYQGGLIGRQLFELVYKIITQSAKHPAGNPKRFAGKLKSKIYRPNYIHLICRFESGLFVNDAAFNI